MTCPDCKPLLLTVELCPRHAMVEMMVRALREVRISIKDSIDHKLSMNNMKYDNIGQQVVKLLEEYDQLENKL